MPGYFRVPLAVVHAIAQADPNPELLATWLALRRCAFGHARELTAAGAKMVAGALGISRPRAKKLIERLLAIRYGERGYSVVLMGAADWNRRTGQSVQTNRGPMAVYVMPDEGKEHAYMPELLIPGGGARSRLADLTDLDDAQLGLDTLRLLVRLYCATSYSDFCGADPDLFASIDDWALDGVYGDADLLLGRMEDHRGRPQQDDLGRFYWMAKEGETLKSPWAVVEAVTGGRTEECVERFWLALSTLETLGLVNKVAIVLDTRGRLVYPLWSYGESSRSRLEAVGVVADLARKFHRRAERAALDHVDGLAAEAGRAKADGEMGTGVFVCATKTAAKPIIRTIYAPTLAAPTPDNLRDLSELARRTREWL